MKNKLYWDYCILLIPNKHILNIMKIAFICLFIFISGMFATEAESQNARISLKQTTSVLDLINIIENQTDYLFVYDKKDIDLNRQISVKAQNKTVAEILLTIFKNTDIVYAMQGNNIVLMKKSSESIPVIQQRTVRVTGIVTDEKGDPLAGVNVSAKGTTNGTITDIDGHFSIMAEPETILQFSYIGYMNQFIKVGNSTSVTISMKEDTQALDEVVVVGFGTQKKVNLSGSVSSVDMSTLTESRPITNISNALAGLAAGLQVTSSNNRPGDDNASILIRGKGTLNNSSPLVIIDGMEGEMNSLNVHDIENISVLKDASSAAIYGSRAANGVILITTKTGKEGKLKVSYNGYVAFQSIRPGVLDPVSNYADYMEYINSGYNNSNQALPYSQTSISAWRGDNGQNPLKYPNTNWIEDTFSTGVGTNHTLSMSGGTEKIQFYGAFGYFDNPGVLENAGYRKYNARTNINAQLTSWLKMGMNVSGFVGKAEPGNAGQSATEAGEQASVGAFTWGWATSPAMILRHDGRYGGIQNVEDDVSESGNNVLKVLNSTKGENTTRNIKSRFHITLQPIKDLSVTGSYSYEYTEQGIKTIPVFNDVWDFGKDQIIFKGEGESYITEKEDKRERNYMDIVANYNHRFLDDRLGLTAMVGASQEQYKYEWFNVTRKNLTAPNGTVLDAANGQISTGGNMTQWVMRSYFGRLNLDWENKYLLEFNLRSDGSSRFLSDSRWGYFPSGSIAWRMDQEEFLNSTDWLSNLKIRASYGSLGNNSVGNYSAISSYGSANYVLNNGVSTGWAITALANAGLTWEKTKVTDIGFDFGVLDNRLYGTFDWFNKKTEGILIQLPSPLVHGSATTPTSNAAEVTNKGIELTLGWRDKAGDFDYGINLNYTHVTNNVDKFKGEDYSLNGIYMTKEGLPINSMYMYVADRIIQTDDDLAIVNDMLAKNPDAFSQLGGVPQKGDILFKDLNGDNKIDPTNDRDIVGDTNPKHMFGLNLSAGYKGFDFSIFMQGVIGAKGYLNEKYFTSTVQRGYQITKEIAENSWTDGMTNAKYPKLTYQTAVNNQANTLWIQKKDYLKIRNIQLGYTLPKSVLSKVQLEKVRFYGSLENFFTFTGYKGIDPELDDLSYPTMRQAVIGVNIEF